MNLVTKKKSPKNDCSIKICPKNRKRDYEYGSSWQKEADFRESIYQTMEYVRPVRPSSAKNVDTFVPKAAMSNYGGYNSESDSGAPRTTMRQTRVSVAPLSRRTTNKSRPVSAQEAFGTNRKTQQDRQTIFAQQAARILDAKFSDSD